MVRFGPLAIARALLFAGGASVLLLGACIADKGAKTSPAPAPTSLATPPGAPAPDVTRARGQTLHFKSPSAASQPSRMRDA